MTKFFHMEDRLKEAKRYEMRDRSLRAEMLRLFRDVLEDKPISQEKAGKILDEDFAKDVSFLGYTDELLLLEVDNMTDMLYEKQGSYLQGVKETKIDIAKAMLAIGKFSIAEIAQTSKLTEAEILALKEC